MTVQILIIGCGDVGKRVEAAWQARGARVAALVRDADRAEQLAELDITPVMGDLDDIWSLRRLSLQSSLWYYFAPPPRTGDNDTRMRCLLTALQPRAMPSRCVLISTTGVYGDRGGAWIDETAEPRPGSARARRRLDAEQILRAWGLSRGVAVVVLRVGGIYGPGRWPLARLQAREPLVREDECPYTNRIHIDDLVASCVAAGERGGAGQIYNVCDGQPGTMTQYFNALADATGLPRPPVVTLASARKILSPGMLSYLADSRRIGNRKLREQLGVTLRYPDLAAGIADLVAESHRA